MCSDIITTCCVECWQETSLANVLTRRKTMKTALNEIKLEINDSSSTHNNNFSITLKSKNVDVDKLLPMAKQWVVEHKQKAWQGV